MHFLTRAAVVTLWLCECDGSRAYILLGSPCRWPEKSNAGFSPTAIVAVHDEATAESRSSLNAQAHRQDCCRRIHYCIMSVHVLADVRGHNITQFALAFDSDGIATPCSDEGSLNRDAKRCTPEQGGNAHVFNIRFTSTPALCHPPLTIDHICILDAAYALPACGLQTPSAGCRAIWEHSLAAAEARGKCVLPLSFVQ